MPRRLCSNRRLQGERTNPALLGWRPGPGRGFDDQPARGPLASYGRCGMRLRGDRAPPRTKHGAIERELARSRMEPHHVARSLARPITCLSPRPHAHGPGDLVPIGWRIRRPAERGARRRRRRRDPRNRSLRLRAGSLSPPRYPLRCRIHAASAREAAPRRGAGSPRPDLRALAAAAWRGGCRFAAQMCGRERKGAAAGAAGMA